MRLGLIADIHGNKLALDAVLEQLDRQHVDAILCLGDVAVLGPDPGGVVATLRERRIPVVMGNTDAWLSKPPHPDPIFADLTRWAFEHLAAPDHSFIEAFPATLALTLPGGMELLACHASPRSYDEVLSARSPDDLLKPALSGRDQQIIAGGHTHIQLVRRIGQRHLVNPGSVGLPGIGPGTDDLPVNRAVDWAEFAIIDVADARTLGFTLQRIPIDLTALTESARASGMPHLDWWIGLWA